MKRLKKSKDCLNKKLKLQVCGKFFTKHWLTNHNEGEHLKDSNSSVLQKPQIENVNTNNRILLVGPYFSGKTYLMLEILSRITPERDIYIIKKSPSEQSFISKIKIKEVMEEIKPLTEYKNATKVFDDKPGSSFSRVVDQFFIGGRHNNLDVCHVSQSYFDLPKRTIRISSDINILLNQTLKDIENIYRDVAGYDMNYDEFKELC